MRHAPPGKGPSICSNAAVIEMGTADAAVLAVVEQASLSSCSRPGPSHRREARRASQPPHAARSPTRRRRSADPPGYVRDLAAEKAAAARGSAPRGEETERQRLERELKARSATFDRGKLRQALQKHAADWRAMLRRRAENARSILRRLVAERFVFTPNPAGGYLFKGEGDWPTTVLPDYRVTVYSGQTMGHTLPPKEGACPGRKCHVVDERLRFVARLLDGEKMTALCAEFGISRKTGYKIYDRYKDYGVHGLTHRSRRPYRACESAPTGPRNADCPAKKLLPRLGAPKIREKLRGRAGRYAVRPSAPSTPCSIATGWCSAGGGAGATQPARRCQRSPRQCPLVCGFQGRVSDRQPPGLLPADHHRFCQPLSAHVRGVIDYAQAYAFAVFERTFKTSACRVRFAPTTGCRLRRRTPCMASANCRSRGSGSASASNASARPPRTEGLTSSCISRSRTGHQAGGGNLLQQQARFDAFVQQYNHERPHQALAMNVPADFYVPSHRPYRGLSELDYPLHDWASTVTTCGRICFKRRKVNLSQVFAGQQVGMLGRRAPLARHLHALPFGISTTRPVVSSRLIIRLVQPCYPCLRNNPLPM